MGYIVMYCPACHSPMKRLYIHFKDYGYRPLNSWWCAHCEEHYVLSKGASHAIKA